MEFFTYFLKESMKVEARKRQAQQIKLNAIEEIKEKLKTTVELGDERSEAGFLIELGNVYANNSEFDLSDTMYRQSLAIARQITDKHIEIISLVNLGLTFMERMDYSQAYSYYQKALRITHEIGDKGFKQEIMEHIDELRNMINIEKMAGNGN